MTEIRGTTIRALLPAVLILAAGCGDRDAAEQAGQEAGEVQRGGTAVVTEAADMNHPMGILAATVFDGGLGFDIMNMGLLRGNWQDGRLVFLTAEESPMAIARSYEYVGPDSTALRFHMRSDVRWSDGTPLTAGDVVFTYELLADPELPSPHQNYVEHLDSVTAEDDSTVTFHFARRYPDMVTHSAMPLVPRHVYEDADPAQLRTHPTLVDPAGGKLVVSGPFMVGQWEKGQRVVLVPNPHFRPQPYLDQIVFRIVPEPTTRLVELQTGNVDLVPSVSFDQIPNLRAQAPDVRFEPQPKRYYEYIAYNPGGFPAFADPEIRRALGLAIDVPELLRALQMEEYAVQAGGPYPPVLRDLYDPQRMTPLPHDPERARQILEAKGWRDADGDGIREKDGQPFSFTLVTNAGSQRRADVTQIVQQAWREIGVDAQLQQLEFNTLMERLFARDYQAALGGWQAALSPDLTTLFGPDAPLNITGYDNPEVMALFEQALAQPTAEKANPYWQDAAVQMAQDQPYTWLYFYDQVNAVSDRLRNTEIDSYGTYQNTWEWWLADGGSTTTGSTSQ